MRQANSTIKGYSYQFNKSILEILESDDGDEIVLEGVIEDIDVISPSGTSTIQCKYHEEKKFRMSDVAVPIFEMLCHYCEHMNSGKQTSYILYAYYAENNDGFREEEFVDYLKRTKSTEVFTKYFHRIYAIQDQEILCIANKARKTEDEKRRLVNYYSANRQSLCLRVNMNDFWNCFTYEPAKQFDELKDLVIRSLKKCMCADNDDVVSLFYPNAIAWVAELSAKDNAADRTVSRRALIHFLQRQKSVLLNGWVLETFGREKTLKNKKAYLAGYFQKNPSVRVFVFSDGFLQAVGDGIIAFICEYIAKYYRKPKLHKQPIFIFGNSNLRLMREVIQELYKRGKVVNDGYVGGEFLNDDFINNTSCSNRFVCKIALLKNIGADVLKDCNVDELYLVGKYDNEGNVECENRGYYVEKLDVMDIKTLRYLVGLSKKLEV